MKSAASVAPPQPCHFMKTASPAGGQGAQGRAGRWPTSKGSRKKAARKAKALQLAGQCAVAPPADVHQVTVQPPVQAPSRKKAQKKAARKAKAKARRLQRAAKAGQRAAAPPADVHHVTVQPPVQTPAPEPRGSSVTVDAGGLGAVDIGVAVTAPASAVVQPSTAPAGRPVKKGVRRCGVEGAAGAACSSTGLLSTALSTAAALPTASAAGSVFHFEATAESNAAVATASTADAAAPAAPNPKKRAADDDAEVVDSTTSPLTSPIASAVVNAVASPAGGVPVPPDAKRARCDVVDLDLDKVIELLEGSGARLVYRTGRAREPLEQADWTVLPPTPEDAVGNPLRYEPLDHGSSEYQRLQADFESRCLGKGFQVTRVCKVVNDWLLYEFQERVRRLEEQCGDVAVLRVYHGTPRANVHSIAMGNLDRRYAGRATNHAWWGKGVNFSPISYYASHYGDQGTFRSMIVSDVVVGRACSVRGPAQAPPLPGLPVQRYDTNIKLPQPQVICKFLDHQFYPTYIIDYTVPPRGHRSCPEVEVEWCPWWYTGNYDVSSGLWLGGFGGIEF
ncbi:uncharacterized protein LOC117639871 [Thrips palmi]|uniref:Uncharacterized protein LOC117639871 n=1 Tax=Thrips palmi TaxID=161013 RepID=A0A6P8XX99_THRPL|nr:uncharacterized protein LOC117639871 [Thrips palmi]